MTHFNQTPEFQKDFKRLSKKFYSLSSDLQDLEDVIVSLPTGSGKNFTILHNSEDLKIVKTRMVCKTLRNRSVRVIYAYHSNLVTFMYIEIYFKGDKENEDRGRIEEYIRTMG